MATTVSDSQLNLAYRLGSDSAPSNAGELARRLAFIDRAVATIYRRGYWWWTEAEATFTTDSSLTSYGTADGLPSDLRDIYEIKIGSVIYHPIDPQRASEMVENPLVSYTLPYGIGDNYYYMYGGELHFLPNIGTTGLTVNIKYWKKYEKINSGSTLLIPDDFAQAVDAFAYGRLMQIEDERGSAADGFDEFDEIMREMRIEHNRRAKYNKPAA